MLGGNEALSTTQLGDGESLYAFVSRHANRIVIEEQTNDGSSTKNSSDETSIVALHCRVVAALIAAANTANYVAFFRGILKKNFTR